MPPPAGPFALGDPVATEGVLTAAGFTDVEFEEISEPVHYGPEADAYDFVTGCGMTRAMLTGDVDQTRLTASDTLTYCPYKGDASYYSLTTPDGELTDVIWTYREPYPAVADIAGHVAFYATKVEITTA